MVHPDQAIGPRISSAIRPDGTMVSRPLEDLFPFLERDEFRSNMIIPPLPD
jgi:acetolactate synthase-1/2/3 large subunit